MEAAAEHWGQEWGSGSPEVVRRGGLLDGQLCRTLCTARGCCQLLQLLFCLLMIVCSSVSYNAEGGYTGLFQLSSTYYYYYGGAYSGFSGADGTKAQQLDAQFHQLKRPLAQAAMAISGALMAVVCVLLGLGLVRLHRRCPAWLLVEGSLEAIMAIGLVPGLYFYYCHLQNIYSSQVCRERESLYNSKGYSGFGCNLHGAEIAMGFITGVAIMTFFIGAGMALRDFRNTQQKPRAKPTQMDQI